MKSVDNRIQTILALVCGSCTTLLIILIMNKDYPFVGHDYRYFIPRLIDTNLHIQLNGASIQWYTPSFGGGLPAFPNPQHIEYSIVQWLSTLINPWSAILLSTAGISLIGYYFFYKFLNEKLELAWSASILGAMFFIGNGFYIEHLIAGMIGYQLFPLGAIILYSLTDERNKYLYNATVVAVVLALMIHQAGFYLIIIFLLSFSITLPLLFLYKPYVINLHRVALTTIASFVLFAGMAASKIYATYAFMRHFPRLVGDTYQAGFFESLTGIIAQLLGVMTLTPVLIVTRQNPAFLSGALSKIIGTEYGIWETDAGLSPVLNVILALGLARAISHVYRNIKQDLNHISFVALVCLAISVWFTIEMILAKGILYTTTKQLPVFRSLHVNVRFTAAFVVPLVIIGAFQLHRYFLENSKFVYFFTTALLTGLSLLSYFALSNIIYESDFSVDASNAIQEEIRNGKTFLVRDITDSVVAHWEGFSKHSSLYQPYEPIFGYELEAFSSEIYPGKILEVSEGYFNMTNPASLVFPEINGLYPFERFKANERDKLEIFLGRRQPEWKLPTTQKILNRLSLLTIIFSAVVLFTRIGKIITIIKQARNTE